MSSCFPWLERAGGEGGWGAGPGPGRQFFLPSLFPPLVQALSLQPGEGKVCNGEGTPLEWGLSPQPRSPPRAGTELVSFQRVLTWDSPACPARFLRAGCRGLRTPPCLATGKPRQVGLPMEDETPVNFCPLAFVHVGVL